MAFKKTYAFIRGTWDGTPGSSNFTQSNDIFITKEEFTSYVTADMINIVEEYLASGDIIQRASELSADGKTLVVTTEFIDESTHDDYLSDSRWDDEPANVKYYDVAEATMPADIGTFDEGNKLYFAESEHLF